MRKFYKAAFMVLALLAAIVLFSSENLTAQELTVPDDLVVECGSSILPASTGSATATAATPSDGTSSDGTSSDGCELDLTVTYADIFSNDGSCGGTGVIIRTWTVVDDCGSVVSEEQQITLEDTTPPVLAVDDVTVSCSGSLDPSEIPGGAASASDACDTNITPTFADSQDIGSLPCGGEIVRTWTAADACGNSAVVEQLITVISEGPGLSVPDDISLACGATADVAVTGTATASDGCDLTIELTPTFSDVEDLFDCDGDLVGTIIRTWSAVDDCGTEITEEQVIAIGGPSLTLPDDVTLECSGSLDTSVGALGSATATDSCDPDVDLSTTFVDNTDGLGSGCGNTGEIIRTWTAVSECGVEFSLDQIITIEDTTPPVFDCSALGPVEVGCGLPLPPLDLDLLSATDACSDVTIVHGGDQVLAGDDFYVTNIERTYLATDECGNTSECTQLFTYNCTPIIGSWLFVDINCNGVRDPGEPGIGNVLVTLVQVNDDGTFTDVHQIITNPEGFYVFVDSYVEDGATYYVTFDIPDGYTPTIGNVGTDDTIDSDIDSNGWSHVFTVGVSPNILSVDAGIKPTDLETATVCHQVVIDSNGNGVADADDEGAANVEVTLNGAGPDGLFGTGDDTTFGPVFTDADGFFCFTDISEAGLYYVSVNAPDGYIISPFGALDPGTGDSPVFTVVLGTSITLDGDFLLSQLCGEDLFAVYAVDCDPNNYTFSLNIFISQGQAPFTAVVDNGAPLTYEEADADPIVISGFTSNIDFTIQLTDANGCSAVLANPEPIDCAVLPVELITFDGKVQESGNLISWSTASEDLEAFILERSIDGQHFEAIAQIDGEGSVNEGGDYNYLDIDVESTGVYYYRLAELRSNGNVDVVSNVIELERTSEFITISDVSPIPTSDVLNVTLNAALDNSATLKVFNVLGQKVFEQAVIMDSNGPTVVQVDVSAFATGAYVLNVESGSNVESIEFVVSD